MSASLWRKGLGKNKEDKLSTIGFAAVVVIFSSAYVHAPSFSYLTQIGLQWVSSLTAAGTKAARREKEGGWETRMGGKVRVPIAMVSHLPGPAGPLSVCSPALRRGCPMLV